MRFDWVRGYPAYESAKGSIGDSKVYDTKNWAPRLGFAYDLTGDGKTVLKGTYSQYYEGAFFLAYSPAVPGIEDFVGLRLRPAGRAVRPGRKLLHGDDRSPNPLYRVDPNIKHPRVDEWTAGFERAIGQGRPPGRDRHLTGRTRTCRPRWPPTRAGSPPR